MVRSRGSRHMRYEVIPRTTCMRLKWQYVPHPQLLSVAFSSHLGAPPGPIWCASCIWIGRSSRQAGSSEGSPAVGLIFSPTPCRDPLRQERPTMTIRGGTLGAQGSICKSAVEFLIFLFTVEQCTETSKPIYFFRPDEVDPDHMGTPFGIRTAESPTASLDPGK